MKKIVFSLLLALLSASMAFGAQKAGCILAQKGSVEVAWKAFKTPAKAGVSGIFNDVAYTPTAKEGENFRTLLVGSSVIIDTAKVNSKHEGRDATLFSSFFNVMSSKNIEAKITDIKAKKVAKGEPKAGIVYVEIDMNGVKRAVPMSYIFKDGVFEAKGVVDILDFGAGGALSSINKACFDLHEGKTWSDVEISFKMKIEAVLCNVKPLS